MSARFTNTPVTTPLRRLAPPSLRTPPPIQKSVSAPPAPSKVEIKTEKVEAPAVKTKKPRTKKTKVPSSV